MTRHQFRWTSLATTESGRLMIRLPMWTRGRSRRRPLCAVCHLDMHATPHRRLR